MRAADQEGQWDSKCQGEEVGKEVQSWGVGVEQNAFVMDGGGRGVGGEGRGGGGVCGPFRRNVQQVAACTA